jgi:hypothetical protein
LWERYDEAGRPKDSRGEPVAYPEEPEDTPKYVPYHDQYRPKKKKWWER